MAITYKVPNEPFEGSPVKRPQPKPRSKTLCLSVSQKLEGMDRFDQWSSKDGVQLRDRSSSYSGGQPPQPKPRISKSVRYVDRPTASAGSSLQADRCTKRQSLQSTPLVHALHDKLSKQLTIHDKTTEASWSRSPESTADSPKLKKGPFSLNNSLIDKRQRASSESKKVTRTPPERPPPYIPKKKKQYSLSMSHSKTPPRRHPGFNPHHFSSPPPLVQTTPTIRDSSSLVPSISAAEGIEVSRGQKHPPRKILEGHHDYEELDKPVPVDDPYEALDNSNASSEDEDVVDSKSTTTGVPDLPPRSIPRVVVKKHRLLPSSTFEQRDGEESHKNVAYVQDTGEYEAFDNQSEESDNVSEDSYTPMDGGGIKKEVCFEEDQQEDIYIEMNPNEFIQPPKSYNSS